jgi:arylformamidase
MKIVDLTYDIHEGMTTFDAPWHPKVSVKQLGRHGHEGRETREVTFGTHTGTQVDAPLHFISRGRSIEQMSLKKLIGPVTIIDFSNFKENAVVVPEVLRGLELKPRVIFKFGWGKYWGTRKFYKNYPFFSKEAARYLISKGVELVAMDTPSPDDGRIKISEVIGEEQDSPIHKIFLKKGVILVEYLAGLNELKDYDGWTLVAAPLRIKGADGSPARVFIFK